MDYCRIPFTIPMGGCRVLAGVGAVLGVCHALVGVLAVCRVPAGVGAVPMVAVLAGDPMAGVVDGVVLAESMVSTVCHNRCTMGISDILPSQQENY